MTFARVTMAALLLGAAACAGEDEGVRIRSFELERAEPPADDRGGSTVVRPRSDLHFRWHVAGDVQRIALTANEKPLASFEGGGIPRAASDLCTESACGTANIGQVEYRLTAWDASGRSDSAVLPVRVSDQGLQILSFTSETQSIDPGTSVELTWQTSGAVQATIEAMPLGGGGDPRVLGTFDGVAAARGTLVDENLVESTLYRLTARDEAGKSIAADITLPLRSEAFITAIESSSDQVVAGEPFELSWRSVGLERLTILRDDGGETIEVVEDADLADGSRTLTVTRETTFSFVGVSVDGAVVTDRCDETGCVPASALVRIHPGPTVHAFSADAGEIESGGETLLRWSIADADEITIAWVDATGNHQEVFPATVQSMTAAPADTTRYTLVATGGGKTASRQLLLGVRPNVSISGPNTVEPGEVFDLVWSTAGATQIELVVGGRTVELSGAPVSEGSVTVQADPTLVPGDTLEVLLSAKDDESPRRSGKASLQIRVE